MFEEIEWEDVYKVWKNSSNHFPKMLSTPVSAETIFVDYKKDGYFYGYDWLQHEEVTERKALIEKNPKQFYCSCRTVGFVHSLHSGNYVC